MAKSTTQQTSKKKTLREKAEKQKKPAVKAVLQNPFKSTWPSIPHEKQQEVLEHLERLLQPLYKAAQQNGKKKKNPDESREVDPLVEKIRSNFVLGVNSVTRMLEKDKLSLVLVCKSAYPPIIVKHLAELSSVRCCPAMLINGLDSLLCSKLKIRSAVAIGFKKRKNENGWFHEFISTVNPPEIHFPYLNNHVAKFIIDKKGDNIRGQFGCENIPIRTQPYTSIKHKSFSQNQNPVTAPIQTSISKFPVKKSVNKKKKQEKNPFRANENFISLGSVGDDEGLKGLNLNLRHVKTQDSMWNEIFAMRIVDNLNSKGISATRDDVHPVEINLLKTATLGNKRPENRQSVLGYKRKESFGSGGDFQRKKFKIWEEKPEYRVSEIKRIKGNVDKKMNKRKKKRSVKQILEMGEKLEKKDKKEKSHLNKKKKSKLNKLKKALKKINKLKA